MKQILIADQLDEKIIDQVQKSNTNFNINFNPEISQEDLLQEIINYDGLIVRNRIISSDIIKFWVGSKRSDNLCITRAGSNTSTIDVKEASENGVIVMNTPGANAFAVSQYVIMQLLYLSHIRSIKDSVFDLRNEISRDKKYYKSVSFMGDKLCLIGTGAIGSLVSKIAFSMGMKVMAYSPNLTEERAEKIFATRCKTIEDALDGANIVSIQVPFVKSEGLSNTFHLLNKERLNLISDRSYLINVSRKDVVEMNGLEELYNSGKFSGIALDLLLTEIKEIKNTNKTIWDKDDVLITPLIATETEKCESILTQRALNQTVEYLKGNISKVSDYFVNSLTK
jgi:D-3-phosphoglycerate dehydrogenase